MDSLSWPPEIFWWVICERRLSTGNNPFIKLKIMIKLCKSIKKASHTALIY